MKIVVAGACMFLSANALAFDNSFYGASAPNSLEARSLVLGLSHGFATKVVEDGKMAKDLQNKSFGFKTANVGISVKYTPTEAVSVYGVSNSAGPEYGLGVGYVFHKPLANAEIAVSYRTQRDGSTFRNSSFSLLSLDSEVLKKWLLMPVANLGYDYYNDHWAAGLGLAVLLGEENRLFVEAFPRFTKESRNSMVGKKASFDAGWRWSSGGHQFFVLVSNGNAAEVRQSMLGTETNDLGFAFRITRLM